MATFTDKTILITGGTDGMGAASALAFCKLGAKVIIIGRSEDKANAIISRSIEQNSTGSISSIIVDFSLMKNVQHTAEKIAAIVPRLDIIIHGVGILITRTEHTTEGIEKDFAVSYLSRFVLTEKLFQFGLLTKSTIMLNIAASSPKIPSFAKMEFSSLKEVQARVGMKSHGQAQLANDLYTALAAKRYGIITIGYGPGSVHTSIRREVPKLFQWMMKPFFYFFTRMPEQVAKQFTEIISNKTLKTGNAYFFNKKGQFNPSNFITNEKRQADLLKISNELSIK